LIKDSLGLVNLEQLVFDAMMTLAVIIATNVESL
jgi:hypothetical protein